MNQRWRLQGFVETLSCGGVRLPGIRAIVAAHAPGAG
jgi:hypothetical protein